MLSVERIQKNKELADQYMMNNVGVVLWDIDGMIINAAGEALDDLSKKSSESIWKDIPVIKKEISQIGKWQQITAWLIENGVDEDLAAIRERWLWNDRDLISDAQPIEGAPELLSWLESEAKIPQVFHTSRPPIQERLTQEALKEVMPNYFRNEMLSIRDTNGISGTNFKIKSANSWAEYMQRSNYFIHRPNLLVLEDNPTHAVAMANSAKNLNLPTKVICVPLGGIDSPYLRDEKLSPNLYVIRRDSEDQNIWPLLEAFSGKDRSEFKRD